MEAKKVGTKKTPLAKITVSKGGYDFEYTQTDEGLTPNTSVKITRDGKRVTKKKFEKDTGLSPAQYLLERDAEARELAIQRQKDEEKNAKRRADYKAAKEEEKRKKEERRKKEEEEVKERMKEIARVEAARKSKEEVEEESEEELIDISESRRARPSRTLTPPLRRIRPQREGATVTEPQKIFTLNSIIDTVSNDAVNELMEVVQTPNRRLMTPELESRRYYINEFGPYTTIANAARRIINTRLEEVRGQIIERIGQIRGMPSSQIASSLRGIIRRETISQFVNIMTALRPHLPAYITDYMQVVRIPGIGSMNVGDMIVAISKIGNFIDLLKRSYQGETLEENDIEKSISEIFRTQTTPVDPEMEKMIQDVYNQLQASLDRPISTPTGKDVIINIGPLRSKAQTTPKKLPSGPPGGGPPGPPGGPPGGPPRRGPVMIPRRPNAPTIYSVLISGIVWLISNYMDLNNVNLSDIASAVRRYTIIAAEKISNYMIEQGFKSSQLERYRDEAKKMLEQELAGEKLPELEAEKEPAKEPSKELAKELELGKPPKPKPSKPKLQERPGVSSRHGGQDRQQDRQQDRRFEELLQKISQYLYIKMGGVDPDEAGDELYYPVRRRKRNLPVRRI